MTYTTNNNITLLRSEILTDWNAAETRLIFAPPPGLNYSTDLWAPELHLLNGSWYIIFTADPNFDSPPPAIDMLCDFNCPAVYHRMFVLEGEGVDPWTADFSYKGELDTFGQFAIDGTYFQHPTGLYHVYSCWFSEYQSWPANLCITKSIVTYIFGKFWDRKLMKYSGKSIYNQLQPLRTCHHLLAHRCVGKNALQSHSQ